MKIGRQEHEPHLTTLRQFLHRYRNTPHPVTGASPAELFLKRFIRTELDLLKPCYKDIVGQEQEMAYDGKKAKHQRFQVEQQIVARDYRQGKPCWSEGKISSILSSRSYLVTLQDGTIERHSEQIHKWERTSEASQEVQGMMMM